MDDCSGLEERLQWRPEMPLNHLPEDIRQYFMYEASLLLEDLARHHLEVKLAPAPQPRFDGHKIRVVENQNPEWYRSLYALYPHFRRDRSVKALVRIATGEDRPFRVRPYKYDCIFRALILERLTRGYVYDGYQIPPNPVVVGYFKNNGLGNIRALEASLLAHRKAYSLIQECDL